MSKKMKLYMSKNERDELCESLKLLDDDAVIRSCQNLIDLFDGKFARNIEKFKEDMVETGSDQEYSYDNKEFFVIDYPDVIYNYLDMRRDAVTEIPYFLEKQIIMRK